MYMRNGEGHYDTSLQEENHSLFRRNLIIFLKAIVDFKKFVTKTGFVLALLSVPNRYCSLTLRMILSCGIHPNYRERKWMLLQGCYIATQDLLLALQMLCQRRYPLVNLFQQFVL